MSKNLKGTKTEKNLLAAFAGESQARTRYTFFASAAEKEGYLQMGAVFTETADNEKEHAKRFFKHLEGGKVEIIATYPAGIIGTTAQNLLAAAEGEHEEWTALYVDAAGVARQEGFPEVAETFENIAKVETQHEQRFRKLLANIESSKVFKKEKPVEWKCRNCGYVHTGNEAPVSCPACRHPQKYFELRETNY
jgi:rubrerythrin